MAENVMVSVKQEIDRLQDEIDRRTSELSALNEDLTKHQKAYEVLSGGSAATEWTPAGRTAVAKAASGDWNAMLQGLPDRFTVGDLTREAVARQKSPAYVRQVAVRWVQQKKTKRVGRGQYQKIQQGNKRPATRSRKRKG